MITRRTLLSRATTLGLAAGLARHAGANPTALARPAITKVARSEAQWRALLTPAQFDVLRQEGTEHPFTSPLNNEHRRGTFVCVACDLALFASSAKYDSGTGWPSFFQIGRAHV